MAAGRQEWFLVFYSVPSHPVSNRMKIWRKLAKVGAVQLKGAVYVLPVTEEHEEFLQWLAGEVKSMGGDAAFVRTGAIETMEEGDVQKLFTLQSEKEYLVLEKELDVLDRKVQSIRKGTRLSDKGGLIDKLDKAMRDFDEIRKRDFFSSPRGSENGARVERLKRAVKGLDSSTDSKTRAVPTRQAGQYKGRVWITRKQPFVDRMASAWLIKKYIDPSAVFRFIDEQDMKRIAPNATAFDIRGGEFTHWGDLCTFEVLVKAFGVKDKPVRKIAEIVHDLDVKDEKYSSPAARGVEEILTGIRKSGKNDDEMLEKGISVFEMLYQSAK